jgi:hypothetical protein
MAKSLNLRTRISTKRQVVLPKALRDRRGSIEEMHEGVLEQARRRWLRKSRDFD